MKRFLKLKYYILMNVFILAMVAFQAVPANATTQYSVKIRVSDLHLEVDGDSDYCISGWENKGELYLRYSAPGYSNIDNINDRHDCDHHFSTWSFDLSQSESPFKTITVSQGEKVYIEVRDSDWGSTSTSNYDLLFKGYITVNQATSGYEYITSTVCCSNPHYESRYFGITNQNVYQVSSAKAYSDPWGNSAFNSPGIDVKITVLTGGGGGGYYE